MSNSVFSHNNCITSQSDRQLIGFFCLNKLAAKFESQTFEVIHGSQRMNHYDSGNILNLPLVPAGGLTNVTTTIGWIACNLNKHIYVPLKINCFPLRASIVSESDFFLIYD